MKGSRWLATLVLIATLLSLVQPVPATAQASCTFTLGFADLRAKIPNIVGQCLENEHFNPANGNAEQRTTGGLLVWRKADNWTAFTDGSTTWINGPYGLQSRPNDQRFAWEAGAPQAPPARPSASGPLATPYRSGWATVLRVSGATTLQAEGENGQRFTVEHIGVIGPTPGQGDWLSKATAEHARQVSAGSRVWLEAEGGLADPINGLALRHVLRDGDPNRPVGADLLEAGTVWVFPHAAHSYTRSYADAQARAVEQRAGAWAETRSSAVFRPNGEAFGGFPINPVVRPALQALDSTAIGHEVLVRANAFPVEIGVTPLPPDAAGFFQGRYYTIQLSEALLSAPPETVGAVLIHEITHAVQMIDGTVDGRDVECYAAEVEAFEVAARYWLDLHGREGKRQPSHWLDREMNATLRQYLDGTLDERVRAAYGRQCRAA